MVTEATDTLPGLAGPQNGSESLTEASLDEWEHHCKGCRLCSQVLELLDSMDKHNRRLRKSHVG